MGELLARRLRAQRWSFALDSGLSPDPFAPHWRIDASGLSTISFHEGIVCTELELILDRLCDTLPLLDAAARSAAGGGACLVNVGDEGHVPGLAFCDRRPAFTLVTDCMFLASEGYASLARRFRNAPVPWRDRRPVLFWRGSSTGQRTGAVTDLPRVRLCLKAAEMGDGADVGLSSLVQMQDEAERDALLALNIVKPFSPQRDLNRVKFHVDIDGNTNSWPGLLTKLHSGGVVLKVASPFGFRQWYYDRLRPWENHVPVASDLSDLEAALDRLRVDDALAEAIGREGRRLARAMTLEREVALAQPSIHAALAA